MDRKRFLDSCGGEVVFGMCFSWLGSHEQPWAHFIESHTRCQWTCRGRANCEFESAGREEAPTESEVTWGSGRERFLRAACFALVIKRRWHRNFRHPAKRDAGQKGHFPTGGLVESFGRSSAARASLACPGVNAVTCEPLPDHGPARQPPASLLSRCRRI